MSGICQEQACAPPVTRSLGPVAASEAEQQGTSRASGSGAKARARSVRPVGPADSPCGAGSPARGVRAAGNALRGRGEGDEEACSRSCCDGWLGVAAVIVIAMVGCSSGAEDEPSSTAPAATQPEA